VKYIEEIKDKYTIDELKHTLFRGDNRKILKSFPDECVDLVYIDPPFYSLSKYFTSAHSGEVEAYNDMYQDIEAYKETIRSCLLELKRVLKNTGSIYVHCDHHASHYIRMLLDEVFGYNNFRNEIIWLYKTGGTSKKYFGRKHDNIFFYTKTNNYCFNLQKEKSYTKSKSRKPGVINYGKGNAEFFEDENGIYNLVNTKDVWEISYINSQSKERLGYPTQKPLTLLEKIIKASSNKGDIVLDCFMGSGTTLDSAYSLSRIPIGIDIGLIAINTTLRRCKQKYKQQTKELKVIGMNGHDIEDYKILIDNIDETKSWKPRRFERIMCMLEGAEQTQYVKDGGIDGIKPNGELVQIKQSESVSRPELQKFFGVLKENNQRNGVLIAYSFSKDLKVLAKKLQKDRKCYIELKTPLSYVGLIEVVSETQKEIEQEIEEEKAQTNIFDY